MFATTALTPMALPHVVTCARRGEAPATLNAPCPSPTAHGLHGPHDACATDGYCNVSEFTSHRSKLNEVCLTQPKSDAIKILHLSNQTMGVSHGRGLRQNKGYVQGPVHKAGCGKMGCLSIVVLRGTHVRSTHRNKPGSLAGTDGCRRTRRGICLGRSVFRSFLAE